MTTITFPPVVPGQPVAPDALRKFKAELQAALALIERLEAAEARLAGGQTTPLSARTAPRGELRGLARVAAAINAQVGAQSGGNAPVQLVSMAASHSEIGQPKPLFGLARAARAISRQLAPQILAVNGVRLVTLTAECGRNFRDQLAS